MNPDTPNPQNTPAEPEGPLTPESVPMTVPKSVAPESAPKTHYLAIIIGILVLAIALVLGGLYLWGAMLMQSNVPAMSSVEEGVPPPPDMNEMAPPSDDINALEAELQNDEFESIDAELNAIDAEIEGGAEAQ